MTCFVQYVPYRLKQGTWDEKRERLGDLVVRKIGEYAPNVPGSVLARQVLTPLDLERTYGLTEGNIFHGDLALEQLFFMRPVPGWSQYRTPVDGLYLCGAGAHPGGGVTGAPGRNAARQILKDLRRSAERGLESRRLKEVPWPRRASSSGCATGSCWATAATCSSWRSGAGCGPGPSRPRWCCDGPRR